MTARLLDPSRRWALAGLAALGLLEAGALSATAMAVERVIAGGPGHGLAPVALGAAGAAAAGIFWWRQTAAERFGMGYVNALRLDLAAHAVAVAGAGRRRRLGALAVRLTSDLTSLRDWAAVGISDVVAGMASVIAGFAILAAGTGAAGLAAGGAGLGLALLAGAAVWRPLRQAHQALRLHRGRVSAAAGDIVLAAPALAQYDARGREARRMDRRGAGLLKAAVRRRSLAALIGAPATAAMAAGVLAAGAIGVAPGAWPGLLMGLGFIAAGAAAAARASDAFLAFDVALGRMRGLAAEAEAAGAAKPIPAVDAPRPARLKLTLPDGLAVKPGDIIRIRRPAASDACRAVAALARLGPDIGADPDRLAALSSARRAQWYPLVAPGAPLLRGSLRRNLALNRPRASDADLIAALVAAGLDPAAWPLERRIDPALDDPDPWAQGRLRLARALAHRPKVVFLAEPALIAEPDYEDLLAQACKASGAAIVAAARA